MAPLPEPSNPIAVASDTVVAGPPIPALDRIKLFSSDEWEDFVLEWADSMRARYGSVERCGGAGDMGRDIVAIDSADDAVWDNYQCKHYDHALRPSDIWVELGKLAFYTQRGDYTLPRAYAFVAPRGAGTKLSNLLREPAGLKQGLKDNWDACCKTGITSTHGVLLKGDLLEHVDGMDFSIFSALLPLKLIDAHAKTRWHVARFGGGLPPRPDVPPPPEVPDESEAGYIGKLRDAYEDHLQTPVSCVENLGDRGDLIEHLGDSRVEFFSAEALRAFSRDTLPPREFEKLQDEVHGGVKDEVRASYDDGYARVVAVVSTARALQLTSHPLVSKLSVHSDDAPGGPVGLHPQTPNRGGELLVRRDTLRQGLMLYQSRSLLERRFEQSGLYFVATERSGSFLDALDAEYVEISSPAR